MVLLRSEQLVGIFICLFVAEDQVDKFRGVDATTVKVGVQGLAGNKGAIGLRFLYKDTYAICDSSLFYRHLKN